MTTDPADELRAAQRRIRRRMLLRLAGAAVLLAGVIAVLAICTGGAPGRPPIARPYLWVVTGTASGEPSYLFGTIHIGYGVADLPAVVLDAQARATITVLESDLLVEPSPDPAPGHAGADRLTAREWSALAEITGVDQATLTTLSSARLLGATLTALSPRGEAMDRGLQVRAGELGQQLAFLETRQLEAVMDETAILEGVQAIAAQPGAFRRELRRILERYAAGGHDGCAAAATRLALVGQLNRDWTSAIEAHAGRGGAFIAIGCGHLAGPDSILESLRDGGLQITRVR